MLPSIWRKRGSLLAPSLDDFIERFFYGWPRFEEETELSWMPRMDIHEADKEFLLDIEVPGIDKKDIKIGVKNDVLTISGERKEDKKVEKSECCRHERHYGKFERSFTLPENIDAEKISADHKNGVLTIMLPKTEKEIAKGKEIVIK